MDLMFEDFKQSDKEGIMVLYIGVTNHWVNIVIHKKPSEGEGIKIYLLDSENEESLNKVDKQIPNLMIEASKERIKLCGAPYSKFFEKMGI